MIDQDPGAASRRQARLVEANQPRRAPRAVSARSRHRSPRPARKSQSRSRERNEGRAASRVCNERIEESRHGKEESAQKHNPLGPRHVGVFALKGSFRRRLRRLGGSVRRMQCRRAAPGHGQVREEGDPCGNSTRLGWIWINRGLGRRVIFRGASQPQPVKLALKEASQPRVAKACSAPYLRNLQDRSWP